MKGTDLLNSRMWEAFFHGIALAGEGFLASLGRDISRAPGYAVVLVSLVGGLIVWAVGGVAWLILGRRAERRVHDVVGRALFALVLPLALLGVLLQHH